MRRVAVTGASGLIGTALTAALEKRGDRVVPIGRHPPDGGVAWDLAARRITGRPSRASTPSSTWRVSASMADGRQPRSGGSSTAAWREPSCWPEHWLAWVAHPAS